MLLHGNSSTISSFSSLFLLLFLPKAHKLIRSVLPHLTSNIPLHFATVSPHSLLNGDAGTKIMG